MKRYILYIGTSLLLIVQTGYAQNSGDNCYNQRQPLSHYAFKRMMREYYNFTILGTQTPTTGFKVETSKPMITLKGNIITSADKAVIVNLELTGGLQNDMMQVFAGNQLNGYFRTSLGFNILFENGNNAKYIFDNRFLRDMARKQVCDYREEIQKKIDTMIVLTAIEDFSRTENPGVQDMVLYIVGLSKKDEYGINGYKRNISDVPNYYSNLLFGVVKKYYTGTELNAQDTLNAFFRALTARHATKVKVADMLADGKRLSTLKSVRQTKYDLLNEYEINTYKDIWTSKTISWLNISFNGTNSSLRLYDANSNRLSDTSSFLPSISISYNLFKKWAKPTRFFFLKFGTNLKRENSSSDMNRFDYKKETIINVSPTETLKSERTGTAYVGAFKEGFGIDFPLEVYWTPWESQPIPGFYSKLHYRYSDIWNNKNKLAFDLGITWNVTDADKNNTNLLTIVPYMSWSNLFTEYSDAAKSQQRKLSDLFSVNIKFGIPVNLGK